MVIMCIFYLKYGKYATKIVSFHEIEKFKWSFFYIFARNK